MISNLQKVTNHSTLEIKGSPAQVWGNMLVPARGIMTLQIDNDTLRTRVKTGLEKKESWIRIQNIDSVEISEAPIYFLLAIGVILTLSGFGTFDSSFVFGLILMLGGIAIIVFTLKNKRRCLVINSYRNTVGVFMNMNKSPETYQQFAMKILEVSNQLNTFPELPVIESQAKVSSSNPVTSP